MRLLLRHDLRRIPPSFSFKSSYAVPWRLSDHGHEWPTWRYSHLVLTVFLGIVLCFLSDWPSTGARVIFQDLDHACLLSIRPDRRPLDVASGTVSPTLVQLDYSEASTVSDSVKIVIDKQDNIYLRRVERPGAYSTMLARYDYCRTEY